MTDMLNFQCRQPNRTTMARTLNLALFLVHPILSLVFQVFSFHHVSQPKHFVCALLLSLLPITWPLFSFYQVLAIKSWKWLQNVAYSSSMQWYVVLNVVFYGSRHGALNVITHSCNLKEYILFFAVINSRYFVVKFQSSLTKILCR